MIQQVIKDDTVYINARYLADQYRYAPALLRELYEKSEVAGRFFEGTLFFEKKAWEKYYQAARHTEPEAKQAAVREHFYTHRSRSRQSRYETDDNDLVPPVQKIKINQNDEVAPTKTKARIPVELADATKVKVHPVTTSQVSYLPSERPQWKFEGSLTVEEVYEETEPSTPVAKQAHSTAVSKVESDPMSVASATLAGPATTTLEAKVSESASTPKQASDKAEVVRKSDAKPARATTFKQTWLFITVSTAVLVLAVLLGAFLEQQIIVDAEGVSSSWRLSLQSATAWWQGR